MFPGYLQAMIEGKIIFTITEKGLTDYGLRLVLVNQPLVLWLFYLLNSVEVRCGGFFPREVPCPGEAPSHSF